MRFHRASPQAAARCRRSDACIRQRLTSHGEPVRYQCENGLVDVACPIVVDGRHVGTVCTEAVVDNAPFGAHMYRLDGDERLVFIGYTKKAEEMLGLGHEPLIAARPG